MELVSYLQGRQGCGGDQWFGTFYESMSVVTSRKGIFCVVTAKECNVMVNSEELIGTTEYRTLYAGCRIDRCRYNRGV
jgi:hypothetical protein